jgi:hypothetical protein
MSSGEMSMFPGSDAPLDLPLGTPSVLLSLRGEADLGVPPRLALRGKSTPVCDDRRSSTGRAASIDGGGMRMAVGRHRKSDARRPPLPPLHTDRLLPITTPPVAPTLLDSATRSSTFEYELAFDIAATQDALLGRRDESESDGTSTLTSGGFGVRAADAMCCDWYTNSSNWSANRGRGGSN